MFQSMMLCGRQIIDLYQKHAITVMEYKWEAIKEDAEVGFQIDSLIRLSDWLSESRSLISLNLKTVQAIIETNEEECKYY